MSKLFGYRNSSVIRVTETKTPWSSVREDWVDEQERLAKAWDKFENNNGLKGYRLYKRRFSASSNNSKLNFNNKFPP